MLFRSMLDTNHDSSVNISEFLAFLGRYYPGTNQEVSNAVFSQYDSNRDGQLDFDEFANMIIKFAGNDVDPHKLIDFLCVQVALGDNAQNESAYNSSLNSLQSAGSLLQRGRTSKQGKREPSLILETRGQEKKKEMQPSDTHPVVSMIMRQRNAFLKFGHKEGATS